MVRQKPDEAFALQELLESTSVEFLKPGRREETLDARHLILSPAFKAICPPVGERALSPADVCRVVLGRLHEIGDENELYAESDVPLKPYPRLA